MYWYLRTGICTVIDTLSCAGKVSTLPTRLIPPAPELDFMGRVEVLYNNSWGTICDDAFDSFDASVVCQSLNFSTALCHVREAGFGEGVGMDTPTTLVHTSDE